jgi:hypothetical protein
MANDPVKEEENNAFEGFSYKMMSDQENSGRKKQSFLSQS